MTANPVGTCAACGHVLPWASSSLGRHRTDGTTTGRIADAERCAGSYRPPAEAATARRRMTAAERKLSRELFG